MYAYPSSIPIFSNRETFTQLVRVADDDTGDFVNMSGVIGNGAGFSAAAWNVVAGAVITTSATPIVIPAYPFGSQLSALALTVPPGLAIHANDPITITDLSGVNQLFGYVQSYNVATGALVCQIGCTFQWEVRRIGGFGARIDDGYTPFATPGIGTVDDSQPVLIATLGNGKILFVEPSVVQIQIPESETRGVCLGTYQASMTVSDSQVTRQVFVATLPMVYGGVTQ